MPFNVKLDAPKRMGVVFAGVLLVAGVTLYIAKRNIAGKRRQDLDEYRASSLQNVPVSHNATKRD
ncbi:hypothetical protein H2248_012524 [Termitomyces sp. 'cryptogamus']|nr:hypothetical protein H2248_012524 [Termitomyces sp. 'cryptogamus']